MEYYLVSPLRVTRQDSSALTYHGPIGLKRGAIVEASVGKATVPGIVLNSITKPSFVTKPLGELLETELLPESLMRLHAWIASYYGAHEVATWQTILPRGVGKKRRKVKTPLLSHQRDRTKIVLNKQQKQAVETILSKPAGTSLLHGVTGSGKTQIYIELAKKTIADGRSVIILVPEIALTSQIIAEFIPHFPDLVVSHSRQTEAERHLIWQSLLHAQTPQVVIGPRSALFSPLRDIGLIVIDECHEPSFKQEQSPRYSALRVASTLARLSDARLVMGSATPAVADYYLAEQTHAPIITLTQLARKNTVSPHVELIDMTKKAYFTRHAYLSNTLLGTIEKTLQTGHQALIFHNRRGSAPTTLCDNCGWSAICPRCYVPLTLHADQFALRCHICNHTERVPTACPECRNASVIHKGIGTKRIAEDLAKLFPAARIARFDGDSESTETLDTHYQKLYDGETNTIAGPHVMAKGLDQPHLRTAGVVHADSGLSLPDYSSSERVFQLLAQVSGRVGRNEHASSVIVQSYQPTHPSVQFGIQKDYEGFYDFTIQERKRAQFPPFTYLLKLTCIYKTETAAIRAAQELARLLKPHLPSGAQILGPAPAFYERTRDTYRWQLIIKSPSRTGVLELTRYIPPARWQFDIDPASLL